MDVLILFAMKIAHVHGEDGLHEDLSLDRHS